jgi:hypothetical protein
MLTNNELHILNGRTLDNIFDECTCIEPGGASVFDHFIIYPNRNKHVCHTTVQPFTCYSDHKPQLLTVNFSSSIARKVT